MIALVVLALLGAERPERPPFQALLPKGATATWLVRFDAQSRDAQVTLGVGADGTAWLSGKDTFVPLAEGVEPFRLTVPVDAFAFTPAGALLVVSGARLGVVTKSGFTQLAELPRAGFRVTAPGRNTFLLHEGKDVYRFQSPGAVEHVLTSPEPVDAVAATADRTLVSSAGAVLALEPEPSRALVSAELVVSLAALPDGAFFYATPHEVGYASGGRRAAFIKAPGGAVAVHGDLLYVHLARVGVVTVGPISAFAAFARGRAK